MTDAPDYSPTRALQITWLWWATPFWIALVFVGGTATYAALIPEDAYLEWNSHKYLTGAALGVLFACVVVLLVGTTLGAGRARKPNRFCIQFSSAQLDFLATTYRVTFRLTVIGYVSWALFSFTRGLGIADVIAVFTRDETASYRVKAMAVPIAGVTTLTQLGPVAVVIGFILRKLGVLGNRGYLWIVGLAGARMLIVSERLAVLEILVPLAIVAALTTSPKSKWRPRLPYLPILAGPTVLLLFAAAEYNRSWIYYQTTSTMSFLPWVFNRFLGYYATSYNNSAIFSQYYPVDSTPYFAVQALWNFPGVSWAIPVTNLGFDGASPWSWWSGLLRQRSTDEFNNAGSFLVTFAEFGLPITIVLWLYAGILLGLLYRAARNGSAPAFLALPILTVGLIELPRLIYWTEGRCTPILLALLYVSWRYPKGYSPRRPGAVYLERRGSTNGVAISPGRQKNRDRTAPPGFGESSNR